MKYHYYDFSTVEGIAPVETSDSNCIVYHVVNGKVVRDWVSRLKRLGKRFVLKRGVLNKFYISKSDQKKSFYKTVYCLFSDDFYSDLRAC